MKPCNFLQKYANEENVVDTNSPELKFIEKLCAGSKNCAEEFFSDKTSYTAATFLDAPHGRFEGLAKINEFCNGWLNSFKAASGKVIPVVQTIGGLRAASEIVVRFDMMNGEAQEIPMMIVGDLRTDGKLEGMRIYFWWNWVEGFSAYRAPVFKPTHTTPGELNLLTGYFREYYAMLHNPNSAEALERIMNTYEPDIEFGGYVPADLFHVEGEEKISNYEAIRRKYKDKILYNTPSWRSVRFETIIDNGKTVVIEWVLTMNPVGLQHGSVSQSGAAAYDRGPTGRLKNIRICDNLQPESEPFVDLSKVKENFVTAYPNIDYGWLIK
jgi:hypothetical protein